MNDNDHKGLLPAGLGDMLPPEAAQEARTVESLMERLGAHGYERVKPPLIEFEESLLAGAGQGMASQTFRLMDPVSQRMMGLRTDMTLQVARIAGSRLKDAPRPLRLSYAGQVLRVKGTQLRPERQFAQVGAELIGSDSAHADAEAVLLSAGALQALGIDALSVDLNLPTLVNAAASGVGVENGQLSGLHAALERKDESALSDLLGKDSAALKLFVALLRCAGPASKAIAAIQALGLPAAARQEARRLAEVVALVRAAAPDLKLTVDPVEYRGFEYQTGVSFTLFSLGVRGELGRGGRYITGDGEAATGFTLYLDTIMQAVRPPIGVPRLLLPFGAEWSAHRQWQGKGFVTVAALEQGDTKAEAKRMSCSHALIDGKPVALGE
jgi:ATP phosphoribosyltransferase regulatory subunit